MIIGPTNMKDGKFAYKTVDIFLDLREVPFRECLRKGSVDSMI